MTTRPALSAPSDPRKIRRPSDGAVALWSLLLVAVGCQASGGGPGERDGAAADVLPAACQVGESRPAPPLVRFRVRNTGDRPLFVAVAYSCSVALAVSSCAANYQDRLVFDYNVCDCANGCPVGGPGCPPDGRALAPGAAEERVWGTIVPMLVTRNGQECSVGPRTLPPARYRVSLSVFATQAQAADGVGGRAIQQDFELVPGGSEQVVEVPVALDPAPDAGD
jgi:hypothetical protein